MKITKKELLQIISNVVERESMKQSKKVVARRKSIAETEGEIHLAEIESLIDDHKEEILFLRDFGKKLDEEGNEEKLGIAFSRLEDKYEDKFIEIIDGIISNSTKYKPSGGFVGNLAEELEEIERRKGTESRQFFNALSDCVSMLRGRKKRMGGY